MTLFKLLLTALISLALFGVMIWFSLPNIARLQRKNPDRTALMEERGGAIVQSWVPLSRISPHLRRAVIVAEDAAFYEHEGIDFHEMKESVLRNLQELRWRRGFSTISMQLAKNLYLSRSKTITRKILEILITQKIERELSKVRILEIYLNVIEWGDHLYGAEAASRHYFHKPASALSPAEAAFLAAIIPNPRRWGHWPPGPYIAHRQKIILARMGIGELPPHIEKELEPPEETPETVPESAPESIPESAPAPESMPQSPQLTPIPETL